MTWIQHLLGILAMLTCAGILTTSLLCIYIIVGRLAYMKYKCYNCGWRGGRIKIGKLDIPSTEPRYLCRRTNEYRDIADSCLFWIRYDAKQLDMIGEGDGL